MKSFTTRAISALIAVFVLYFLNYQWGSIGLKAAVIFAVVLGNFELLKILFKPDLPVFSRYLFTGVSFLTFAFSAWLPSQAALIFAVFSIIFCLFSLANRDSFDELQDLSTFQAKSILGFFYLGLLPSFAYQILDLPHGLIWFVVLLAIVFMGDIGAYTAGLLVGRHKLMPSISPKKTIEGSLGGLAFSIATAAASQSLLPHVALPSLLLLGLGVAVVAQFGDLFESLLKRVAEVKDSGQLMPGHGGILDRVDGVLFASPVLLFGALILEDLLK